MKLSEKGFKLLKKFEGFRSKPYKCSAGYLTIGYGHKIAPGEKFDFNEITLDQANKLLEKDVERPERVLKTNFNDLTQNQFDALVCFIFNIGVRGFQTSSVCACLKRKDLPKTLTFWARWNKVIDPETKKLVVSPGLQSRRKAEITLFKKKEL